MLGQLVVTSAYDDGAACEGDLFIDGRQVGRTPFKGPVLAVEHEVRVVCEKGGAQARVTVPHNARADLALEVPLAGSLTWVRIPGGTFMMGSNDGEGDEKPVHRVTVRTFWMTKTEVTFGQYERCVQAGACTAPHGSDGSCYLPDAHSWKRVVLPAAFQGEDQPVVCVDWQQAASFAKWVGGRLPTEAEWEFAARSGGRVQKYPWGNEEATCSRAVMYDGKLGCGRSSTWPVCSKASGNTAQGLCDMGGNVWEWVQDWYHNSYAGAPTDGSAWETPAGRIRVYRGGSLDNVTGYFVRAAFRRRDDPGDRLGNLGFRVARSTAP
jgi:formylglycine-generating enzyme required for sulfatase activity